MNWIANPEMLILAREFRGLTQRELADKSGIDQGRISRYEGGYKSVPEQELEVLAKALSFPIQFFQQNGKRYGAETGAILHRKRQTTSAIEQKRTDSLMNLYRLGLEKLLQDVDMSSHFSIPVYRTFEYDHDIEAIAADVRGAWKLPSGPIKNLIEALEGASCMVISYDFGTDKIDEETHWIEPNPPIILVNRRAPGDRLRFSLAHALGHLVMHHNEAPYPDMEDEADRFASAFLMPANDIKPDLHPVTIEHMLQIKPYWKVSMQALIRRARDLGEISDRRYTSLFEMLSRAGYRKNEPVAIEPEKPKLVRDLLDLYRTKGKFSKAALAGLVGLYLEDFGDLYYPEISHLSVLR